MQHLRKRAPVPSTETGENSGRQARLNFERASCIGLIDEEGCRPLCPRAVGIGPLREGHHTIEGVRYDRVIQNRRTSDTRALRHRLRVVGRGAENGGSLR